VMHRQSADDDHALIRFDPQAAARIDHHGIRRRRSQMARSSPGRNERKGRSPVIGSVIDEV
jgi:hypothetical protein